MIAPLAPGQPVDTSVATGPPQGSGLTITAAPAPLTTYDPVQKRLRAMTPQQQQAAIQNVPKGANASAFAQMNADAAAAAMNADPDNPQNVKQRDLDIEHPSAFAALRSARPGFGRPRKPGRFGK